MGPSEIQLSKAALCSNFELIRKESGGLAVFPVIKANAYGHGADLVAKVLESNFDDRQLPLFCVAQTQEALELRKAGITRGILVLSSFDADDFRLSESQNLSFVLSSRRDIENLLSQSEDLQKRVTVHLKFNTGMNRLGVSVGELDGDLLRSDLLSRLLKSPCRIEGVMSHLARSEEPVEILSQVQANRFHEILAQVEALFVAAQRPHPKWIHLANSGAISHRLLAGKATAIRPGLRIYGVYQDQEDRQLQLKRKLNFHPVLSVRAPLRKIFEVPENEGIGYGHKFVTSRNSVIAVVALGYADGIRRGLGREEHSPNVRTFAVEGYRTPIVGTISMDLITLDLTDHPRSRELLTSHHQGKVILAEWIGASLTVEEVATSLGTISYEIFCGLSKRISRRVVE